MLEDSQRRRRSRHRAFWWLVNRPTRPVAGLAPWWVLLETKGRLTGKPRYTPLARGPIDEDVVWLVSVHGRHALWVRNLETTPGVRIKISGRWHDGRATVHEYDEAIAQRFNLYARTGPRTLGIDPVLIRVQLLSVIAKRLWSCP
jgi:deazaflavin-dependent oxidoreductase (nitroreductase family)